MYPARPQTPIHRQMAPIPFRSRRHDPRTCPHQGNGSFTPLPRATIRRLIPPPTPKNHSSSFWSVRGKYAKALEALHARSYTGDGFWSAGRTLLSDQYTQDQPLAESDMPKHICGGTYRSKAKRRVKPPGERPSYAEQKRRRIERKFGIAGEGKPIGADNDEHGKPKPRVAQSKRGRELRAAAALKRFDTEKAPEKKAETERNRKDTKVIEVINLIDDDSDDRAVSVSDDSEDEGAVNVGGGKFMVAVSAGQDGEAEQRDMDRELMELMGGGVCGPDDSAATGRGFGRPGTDCKPPSADPEDPPPNLHPSTLDQSSKNPGSEASEFAQNQQAGAGSLGSGHQEVAAQEPRPARHQAPGERGTYERHPTSQHNQPPRQPSHSLVESTCPVCFCTNAAYAPTCSACMNVLIDRHTSEAWKCPEVSCHPDYRNSRDVAYCGICGAKRAAAAR